MLSRSKAASSPRRASRATLSKYFRGSTIKVEAERLGLPVEVYSGINPTLTERTNSGELTLTLTQCEELIKSWVGSDLEFGTEDETLHAETVELK